MLQYVSIRDKYKLNVIKYTVIVSAGNFQSAIIVVSNDKDKAVAIAIAFFNAKKGGDKVANGTQV